MADFSELLSKAEKLSHEIEGAAELPKVDRSLRQVLEASNELYARVAQDGAKDIQANILLGSKGIDLPRISQKLDSISQKRTIEAVEPVDDVDVETALRNRVRELIMGVLEAEEKMCCDDILKAKREHADGEWKQQKRKIMNAMVAPTGNFVSGLPPDSLFVDAVALKNTFMTQQEMLYAKKVVELNRRLGKGESKPDLIEYFSSAAEEFKDPKVNDMWEIVKYMTKIPPTPSTEDTISTRLSNVGIMELVGQAKKYLEDRYKTFMSTIVSENLMAAQRGGIPGTYPLVKSFVGIRFQGGYVGLQDGMVDDRPLWAMIYFCLRSGDYSAANECLRKASSNPNVSELKAMLDLKLNNPNHPEIHKLEQSLAYTYRRTVRNDTDPFKRIVWSVLGCSDILDEHSEVAKTADDWLWLKLNLVRVGYEKEDHVAYGDLQRQIVEDYGENHYDAAAQPHMYFQVLMLTGQFEAAFEFLSRVERYRPHAIHMAIALNEMYLLAGPNDYSSPLLFVDPGDPKPSRRLNIVRMMMLYVQRFEINCVMETIHYFYLLHGLYDLEKRNMFVMSVRDLAQETQAYDVIFGVVQPNGIRTRGILDEFRHPEITVEKIALTTAEKLHRQGNFEDAVKLYDLANNQAEVLKLLSNQMAQCVVEAPSPGSLRERLSAKMREMYTRYSNLGFQCSANITSTFCTIRDLMIFFDHYHAKNFSLALKCLNDLKIIPFNAQDLDERIANFKNLSHDITKTMPDIVLATMNIYFAQYQKLKEADYIPSRFPDYSVSKQIENIREQAKVLTNFTGMLSYKMPGDTNSRLVQMEILMH